MKIKRKIRWTDEEKWQVARGVLGSRIKNPESTLISLVNGIVQMMPGDRKRKIRTNKEIHWLTPMLHQLWNNMKDESKRIEKVEVRVEMSNEEMLVNLDTKTILIEGIRRLLNEVDELKRQRNTQAEAITTIEPQKEIVKESKILIVGLESHQIQYLGLNGEYLYHNGKNLSKALPKNIKKCILMTRFIIHAMQDKCINEYGREKIQFVNGCISALKEIL
jgi:hypothetical protein